MAETLALVLLLAKGYRPLARRFKAAGGEIDLVMRRGGLVAFVEVKARRGAALGGAGAAVDARKLLRVRRTAERWLAAHRSARRLAPRIDVVAVDVGRSGEAVRVDRLEACG